ncbi:MAG: D-alanyl-D-alanine carboxypeptidase/D-alanyl-D-alanine-endopeptidase [Ignavibacteria bacterium]|nr:D-alanyl-D-alanine carboxypeptidase/D-alanyl-D-alanine-endopeptidase [Ignavibacteria bacterium]
MIKTFFDRLVLNLLIISICFFLLNAELISRPKKNSSTSKRKIIKQIKPNKKSRQSNYDIPIDRIRLEETLESTFSGTQLSKTRYGIVIYSLDSNRFYFDKNSSLLLTPASTTKLFTSFAALNGVGFNYLIPTSVYTDGSIENDGTLNGNVYIAGQGDALLSAKDIDWIAGEISRQKVKKINGSIFADGSFFDRITDRKAYSGDRDVVQPLPPVTALSINNNVFTVRVVAGATPGEPVSVHFEPESESFIKNITATVRGSKKLTPDKPAIKNRRNNKKNRKFSRTAITKEMNMYGGPVRYLAARTGASSRSNIRISINNSQNGKQIISISGSLRANQSVTYKYHIKDPELTCAGTLKSRLQANGIHISGGIGKKSFTDFNFKKKVLTVFRRPLIDLLYPVNKYSDNYTAEHVFKMLGGITGNHEDCATAASEFIFQSLEKVGFDCDGCRINDGSGLSRRNKVTAMSIVEILAFLYHQPYFAKFDSTLSIAGIDGTLHKRMIGTKAQGNFHGKTGTHANVSALAGYVRTLSGERLAVAMIFNGGSVHNYKIVENSVAIILANLK